MALTQLVAAGDRAKKEVDLLREYGTRLISDVATGKLDVREAAERLPVEIEEREESEADEALASDEGDAEPAEGPAEEIAAEEP